MGRDKHSPSLSQFEVYSNWVPDDGLNYGSAAVPKHLRMAVGPRDGHYTSFVAVEWAMEEREDRTRFQVPTTWSFDGRVPRDSSWRTEFVEDWLTQEFKLDPLDSTMLSFTVRDALLDLESTVAEPFIMDSLMGTITKHSMRRHIRSMKTWHRDWGLNYLR